MKKIISLLLVLTACFHASAQMKQPEPTVFIYVGDTAFPMNTVTSQTEIKQGWDIQGINVGRKPLRYFWGAHAKQTAEAQPKFAIYPRTQTLNDYALIRLKGKKEYRRMPEADVKDCDYMRIDLDRFKIENLPDMGFAVMPTVPLPAGEYILVDLTQEPVNRYGDIRAYDFTVEKTAKKQKK